MNFKVIISLLVFLAVQACDMLESHPYDGNIKGETGINTKNIKRIEDSCKGKNRLKFAFISDTQRAYDETEDFVNVLNKRDDIDFVIHGGDISDFGLTKEFIWMRDILNNLKVPYVVLLGNHDCLANGEDIFHKIFGNENFSFLAGNTKFICLNTNALEFDYSRPVPDFNFMENQANDDRPEYEKTIVAMHVRPYALQFNNNVAPFFQYCIQNYKGIQFCIYGHEHQILAEDLFEDGIMYYQVSNIKKRKYLIFTLKPNNTYDYEVASY
ncbi:MAG: metallophosphoesterase [Tannerella sp.]|jgi:predicted phosphodiesterase|nr:metallophosphoesterase [Tannerella sp.]